MLLYWKGVHESYGKTWFEVAESDNLAEILGHALNHHNDRHKPLEGDAIEMEYVYQDETVMVQIGEEGYMIADYNI